MFRAAMVFTFVWPAMAASVQTVPVVIQLKYADIVDGSPVTHSGRTLTAELSAIRSAQLPSASRAELDAETARLIAREAPPAGQTYSIGMMRARRSAVARRALI